jgi:hypothetical protein
VVNDAMGPYFQDVYDHVLRATEWTESLRDLVSSVAGNQPDDPGQPAQRDHERVTSWAAIIAVSTAITGFYGQKVPDPGFSRTSGIYASTLLNIALSSRAGRVQRGPRVLVAKQVIRQPSWSVSRSWAPGVRPFPAGNDPHTGRPVLGPEPGRRAGRRGRDRHPGGQFGNLGALARVAVGVERCPPRLRRDGLDRGLDCFQGWEPNRVLQPGVGLSECAPTNLASMSTITCPPSRQPARPDSGRRRAHTAARARATAARIAGSDASMSAASAVISRDTVGSEATSPNTSG